MDESLGENTVLMQCLRAAMEENASDLFIIAGEMISMKRDGEIVPVTGIDYKLLSAGEDRTGAVGEEDKLMPKGARILVEELYKRARRSMDKCLAAGDDDFSLAVPGMARFRINVYRQRGSLAAVIRTVSFGIPDWRRMGIPEEVMKIAQMKRGLVLVTGPAGSGKSTTLACVVDAVNRTRNAHIITIEDPIEYLHSHNKSLISQRELATDTGSYVTALRASLRQAPDVILLGEMRDLDTIQTAMTAAETGHLVISTLHTVGAVNTIDRIIDVFPPAQQQQVRVQLAQVLKTVVSQQLLQTADGKMAPAFEIMHLNNAVRTLVRESRIHQIDSVIQTSAAEGMIGMDESILRLFKAGRVTRETALHYAMNPDQLQKKLER